MNLKNPNTLYTVLFLVVAISIVAVWLPFGEKLGGVTTSIDPVDMSFQSYTDGSYQAYVEYEFEHALPSRPGLIRTFNEIMFDAFRKTTSSLVISSDGTLFEENYLIEYSDLNPLSEAAVDSMSNHLLHWSHALTDMEKTVYFVMIPSKPRYFTESYPEGWQLAESKNSDRIFNELKSKGLHTIDLRLPLDSMAEYGTYPVYTKYGIHWSRLGMEVAFENFISVIDTLSDQNSYDFKITEIQEDTHYRGRECDIWKVLNTLSDAPYETPVGKPIHNYSVSGKKHGLLLIGDSFYWSWFGTGLTLGQFSPSYFFYYNSTAHLAGSGEVGPVTEDLTLRALNEVDVVVVMFTEANWSKISIPNYLGLNLE